MKFDLGRELLKVIAIVTMTIDHIGTILFPDDIILNIIGRFSFPIFAYLIVLGTENTRNPMKYMITLFSFAMLSQFPYFLAFSFEPLYRLNILFSLFLSVLTIYLYNKGNILAIVPILISIILPTEGSYYVPLTAVGMRMLKSNTKLGLLVLLALNLPFLMIPDMQVLSLFAVPIVLLHISNRLKKEILIPENSTYYTLRKYAFYIYYPLHLALIYLISILYF